MGLLAPGATASSLVARLEGQPSIKDRRASEQLASSAGPLGGLIVVQGCRVIAGSALARDLRTLGKRSVASRRLAYPEPSGRSLLTWNEDASAPASGTGLLLAQTGSSR